MAIDDSRKNEANLSITLQQCTQGPAPVVEMSDWVQKSDSMGRRGVNEESSSRGVEVFQGYYSRIAKTTPEALCLTVFRLVCFNCFGDGQNTRDAIYLRPRGIMNNQIMVGWWRGISDFILYVNIG